MPRVIIAMEDVRYAARLRPLRIRRRPQDSAFRLRFQNPATGQFICPARINRRRRIRAHRLVDAAAIKYGACEVGIVAGAEPGDPAAPAMADDTDPGAVHVVLRG